MAKIVADNGDVFEKHQEFMDATSIHRPDTSWRFTDSHGHVHQWYVGDIPAGTYSPVTQYITPTIEFIKTGTSCFEDGEPYDIGYYACKECGDTVNAGFTADSYTQYVPGLTHYSINGRSVKLDEFMRRAKEVGLL